MEGGGEEEKITECQRSAAALILFVFQASGQCCRYTADRCSTQVHPRITGTPSPVIVNAPEELYSLPPLLCPVRLRVAVRGACDAYIYPCFLAKP
jgi:hypothetical protein